MVNNKQLIMEGLAAMQSLNEITRAVSTKKRFQNWAEQNRVKHIEMSYKPDNVMFHEGKKFELAEIRKMKGYGAYHIGSDIDRICEQGLEPLIVDCPRNRRFIFKEAK